MKTGSASRTNSSARDAGDDREEFACLVNDDSPTPESSPLGRVPRPEPGLTRRKYFLVSVLTLVIAVYFFFFKKETDFTGMPQELEGENNPAGHSPKVEKKGKKNKKAKYRDVSKMRESYDLGRKRIVDLLKRDYTEELYHKMFEAPASSGDGSIVSAGRYTFMSPTVLSAPPNSTDVENPSWNRLVRKMMMKLLQVQIHDEEQSKLRRLLRSNETMSDENQQRLLQVGVSGDNLTDAAVTFIWVRFISLFERRSLC
jgi:hypothetical protein